MNFFMRLSRLLSLTLLVLAAVSCKGKAEIYSIPVEKTDGTVTTLKEYKGKVMLIVNTATRCGFTPQYTDLQNLYDTYAEKGLVVVDFPCNQFGGQAPGSNEEIEEFCTLNYKTTFPRYAKIDVNGEKEAALYAYLKSQADFGGFNTDDPRGQMMDSMLRRQDESYDQKSDIKWNFTKFLIDRHGTVVARFEPSDNMQLVEQKIKELL